MIKGIIIRKEGNEKEREKRRKKGRKEWRERDREGRKKDSMNRTRSLSCFMFRWILYDESKEKQ